MADVDPGLCARCRHARRVATRRGSSFWLCGLSASDPAFARYPRLPVVRCSGFQQGAGEDPGGGGSRDVADEPPHPRGS